MSFLIARASSGVWLKPHHRCPLAECLCCRSDHGTATPLDPAHLRGVLARCDHPGASRPEPSPLRDAGGLRVAARRRQGCLEPQPGLRRGVYLQCDTPGPRGSRRSRRVASRGHFAGQLVPEAGGSVSLPRSFPGGGSWPPSALTAGGGNAASVRRGSNSRLLKDFAFAGCSKMALPSPKRLRAGRQMQVRPCEIPLAGAPKILRVASRRIRSDCLPRR